MGRTRQRGAVESARTFPLGALSENVPLRPRRSGVDHCGWGTPP